jgi:hypothetical protein
MANMTLSLSYECGTFSSFISIFQHDTNFLTIGRYLNIDIIDDLLPDYASFLAIELHRKDGGEGQEQDEYFVEACLSE